NSSCTLSLTSTSDPLMVSELCRLLLLISLCLGSFLTSNSTLLSRRAIFLDVEYWYSSWVFARLFILLSKKVVLFTITLLFSSRTISICSNRLLELVLSVALPHRIIKRVVAKSRKRKFTTFCNSVPIKKSPYPPLRLLFKIYVQSTYNTGLQDILPC